MIEWIRLEMDYEERKQEVEKIAKDYIPMYLPLTGTISIINQPYTNKTIMELTKDLTNVKANYEKYCELVKENVGTY